MASISLTVNSGVVSGGTLSATINYTVSSTNSQTTFTFSTPAVNWTKPAAVALQWKLTFVGGNTAVAGSDYTMSGSVFPAAGTSGSTSGTPSGTQITWNKKTSDWTIPLKLEVLEGTGSGTTYNYVSRGSKTENLTVPALASYDIVYNANGHGTAPATQKKYYGISLTLAGAISATGFGFSHWNTNASNTGTSYTAGSSYTANAGATLYAIWNRTVSFNANGGSGAPAAQTSLVTSAITITSSVPTRSGYRFKNWNTAANGTGTTYSSGGSYASGLASTVLYAQWEKVISSVSIGSVTIIRTEDDVETDEADEGTYAYITVPYTVTGMAAANIEMSVTATADTGTAPTITLVSWQATKPEDVSQNGTFIARASGCELDSKYSFTITIAANNTSVSQTAVTAIRTTILPTAFFLVDFKAGGKGVHFGGSATEDGFFVSMPATFNSTVDMVNGTANTDTMYVATRTDTDKNVKFGIGSGGVNRGIYIDSLGWMIYYNDTDVIVPKLRSTGQLTITGGNSVQARGTFTVNTTPSSSIYNPGFYVADSAGTNVGYMRGYYDANGSLGLQFEVQRTISGTRYAGACYMYINSSGTFVFSTNQAAAIRSGIAAVNKAGDTMTGDLTISKATPYVNTTHTGLDLKQTNNGISATQYAGLNIKDKNGYSANYFGLVATTAGAVTAELVAYNRNTSGTQTGANYLQVTTAKNGTASYAVANQAAFRNALGASSGVWTAAMIPSLDASKIGSGTLGIARGGTGTSTGVKGWTSLGSTTGTTAKAITASSYTEILVVMAYSTSYRGSCFIPVAALSTTANEWYCGGGGAGGSSTSGRRAVFKATTTAITPVLITIDGTNYTSTAVVTYIYGR